MSVMVILLAWVVCGALAYGLTLAFFQRNWPTLAKRHYTQDCECAIAMGIGGPAGLLAFLLLASTSGNPWFKGLQFKRGNYD